MARVTPTVLVQREVVAQLMQEAVKDSPYKTLGLSVARCALTFKDAIKRTVNPKKGGLSLGLFLTVDAVMARKLGQKRGWLLRKAMSVPVPTVGDLGPSGYKPEVAVIVGHWLMYLMVDRGVTHLQLAHAISSTVNNVCAWTAGMRNMHVSIFLSILYALDVTEEEVDDLLRRLKDVDFDSLAAGKKRE